MPEETVLVTGITGYIGTHVAKVLLDNDYKVRGTVRSLTNSAKTDGLKELFKDSKHPLELVEVDLTKDEGWEDAMKDCSAVMHVSSPFPNVAEHSVKEEDVVKPAIEGTMRAIKAAVKAKVKKVVLTSSVASVCADSEYDLEKVFTEEDWSNTESPTIDVYSKSKALAEKAAWDYLKELPDEEKFDLAVINPSFVMGPALLDSHKSATSVTFLTQILNKVYPGHPRMSMNYCDVRDVANAHFKAMTNPAASNKRHIIFSESLWLKDVGVIASEEFRPLGYNIATGELPYFICWIAGIFNKGMRSYILPRFGKPVFKLDNSRMKDVLGIEPTPMKTSIVDMGHSIIDLGIVKKPKKCKPVCSKDTTGTTEEDKTVESQIVTNEDPPPVKEELDNKSSNEEKKSLPVVEN